MADTKHVIPSTAPPALRDAAHKNTIAQRHVAPVVAAWQRAALVTPDEVEAFTPTPFVIAVGEALFAGASSVPRIAEYAQLDAATVKGVLNDPMAMAWLSRQVAALLTHRACIVDATLFQRACAGDLSAIKLFYERMKLLANVQKVEHNYSGSVELKAVSDDDLKKMIEDGRRTLPGQFKATAIKDAEAEITAATPPLHQDI